MYTQIYLVQFRNICMYVNIEIVLVFPKYLTLPIYLGITKLKNLFFHHRVAIFLHLLRIFTRGHLFLRKLKNT